MRNWINLIESMNVIDFGRVRAEREKRSAPPLEPEPGHDLDDLEDFLVQLKQEQEVQNKIDKANRLSKGKMVRYLGKPAEIIRSTDDRFVLKFNDGSTEIVNRRDSWKLKGYSPSIFDEEIIHETATVYYHGSNDKLRRGTIMTGRGASYEAEWKDSGFYETLEQYRPANMLSHKDAVFMCDNPDDIDSAGGGTEWLFTMVPIGPVQKHDMNWGSLIDCIKSTDYPPELEHEREAAIKEAAENYWNGVPHDDSPLWEYLAPKAKIIAVEEY